MAQKYHHKKTDNDNNNIKKTTEAENDNKKERAENKNTENEEDESFVRKRKIIVEEDPSIISPKPQETTSNDLSNTNNTLLSSMHNPIDDYLVETETNTNNASTPNKQEKQRQKSQENDLSNSLNQTEKNAKFKSTIEFVGTYLEKLMNQVKPFADGERNKLTSNVLSLARSLIYFGFYSLRDLLKLSHILLEILDKDVDYSSTQPSNEESAIQEGLFDTPRKSVSPSSSSNSPHVHKLVVDIRLKIIEIFEFVLNVRLDYRLTYVLSIFKNYCGEKNDACYETDDDERCREIVRRLMRESDRLFVEHQDELFRKDLAADMADMNREGQAEKKFLKIMVKLMMQDHAQLKSGALNLIFRRFSQIQETLNGLKQVRNELFVLSRYQQSVNIYNDYYQELL